MEYSKFDKLKYLLIRNGCGESYATHASRYLMDYATTSQNMGGLALTQWLVY